MADEEVEVDEQALKLAEEKKKILALDEMQVMKELEEDDLQQLLCDIADMDPDNTMLPVGFRQRDQTTKESTGELNRDTLMSFLEEEGAAIPDKEEEVPFEAGVKKGKVFKQKEKKQSDNPYEDDTEDGAPKGKVQLEPEVEQALANASDLELTDLAAVLGLHKMLNNEQLYEAQASGGEMVCTESWKDNTLCKMKCDVIDESFVNDIDFEDAMNQVKSNSIEDLNLNNLDVSTTQMLEVIDALKSNTSVKKFSFANTNANDQIAKACGELLASNSTIEAFNCETNYITTEGIIAMTEPLRTNSTLTELRIANQRAKLATKAEESLMNVMEANNSIRKLGYAFSCAGPRHMVGAFVTRNVDLARQRRTGKA